MATNRSEQKLWDKALAIALKTGVDLTNLDLSGYPELAHLLEPRDDAPRNTEIRAATDMERYTGEPTTAARTQPKPFAPTRLPSPVAGEGAGGEGQHPGATATEALVPEHLPFSHPQMERGLGVRSRGQRVKENWSPPRPLPPKNWSPLPNLSPPLPTT